MSQHPQTRNRLTYHNQGNLCRVRTANQTGQDQMLTLYPAKKVITMNPSMPEAQAILVEDERIVEVGTIEHMQPWLDAKPHRVDDSFTDHIICPGFIDPHLHPSMAAVLLPMEFVTAMRWKLP